MKTLITFLTLLASCSCVHAQTVLVTTDAGVWVGKMVDGKPPTTWLTIDLFWTSIDGDKPPPNPTDPVATQVDKWSDATKDPATRAKLSKVWKEVIADIKIADNNVTIDNADRHISAGSAPIVEELSPDKRAAWVLWSEQVAELMADAISRGTYSLATLESIYAGMMIPNG